MSRTLERLSDLQIRAERDRIVARASELVGAGAIEDARAELAQLEFGVIDDRTLSMTDPWQRAMARGRRIVASFDPSRRPSEDEVVVIYGNYPHLFENLVLNNPMRRHPADFWRLEHDAVESDPRWDGIDRIYLINLDARVDRLDSVLRELAVARAPFDRIVRISASRPRPEDRVGVEGHLACLRSHIEAVADALDRKAEHVLILEDDFTFMPNVDDHLDDLRTFLARPYDYWVCLVATSKYGQVLPRDELVNVSWQECTNATGYLLSRAGAERLLPLFQEAHAQLQLTGEERWAADRCWSVLQPTGRFLVFRERWGYQVSSFSDIERLVIRSLD